jgi:hypothetical protein
MAVTRIWVGILACIGVAHVTLAQEMTHKQKAMVTEAADHASKVLQKPHCATLFGPGAAEAFRSVGYRFVPMGGPRAGFDGSVRVVAALTLRDSNVILINSSGPFVNPAMSRTGLYGRRVNFRLGLSAPDYRALVLLHELGHLTEKFRPDASDPTLSTKYSQLVRDKCF